MALVAVEAEVVERYLRGTRRFKGVEVLVNNYALIPLSRDREL